ncbi:2-oxoacid:ferredoxin oxidoreductase subunit beta [Tepidibacillus fermentans]|uniref:2-oxoglutarate ferredoxin oxidoreductase subunit beta n=1 Tax=Tepidibacillus fermentans TaxID=1281767 RepID=A0A4V2UT75_9BACI|nr:2-oxoacid:ferredoxin oxidoreductase subunit beta [Tepidibacillus fermentans]TCS84449.1 2-oxoglutarate ferredoxin oxidoreductase subunit beta [Tepidibacillus fermentans]
MATLKDFRVSEKATWCPGCGHFTVLAALQAASANLGIEPYNMVLVSGIGCSGKISQHFGSYGFHSLHGRTLPVATGVQLNNHDLVVVAAGGDGDGYGIGIGHFMHALRRNIDMTYIVMDNHIYGLTTGQTSPTSHRGFKSKTSPAGSAEEPVRPVQTAIINGASFVAQAFSGDVKQMTRIMEEAIRHKGFSLINAFSPCVTFNKVNTYDWFKENIYNLDEIIDYDPTDKFAALRVLEDHGSVVTGVIYQEERPVYHEAMIGATKDPTVKLDLTLQAEEIEAIKNSLR